MSAKTGWAQKAAVVFSHELDYPAARLRAAPRTSSAQLSTLASFVVAMIAVLPALADQSSTYSYPGLDDPRDRGATADRRMVGDMPYADFAKQLIGLRRVVLSDFPPGNTDAQFGVGYDSLFTITKQPCVVFGGNPNELVSIGGSGQSVNLHLTHATNNSDLAQSLNISGSASFGFGAYSGNLAVSYFRSQRFSRYAEFLTEDIHVENQAQYLKKAALTAAAQRAARQGLAAFRKLCGDQYIAGIVTGGEFTAVLEATSDSESDQEQTAATFSAAALGNSVSGSALQEMQSLSASGRLSIDIVRKGTFEALPGFDAQSLQDYIRNFPPKVVPEPNGHPWAILALTKTYDGLVNFPEPAQQRRALEQLSMYLGDMLRRRSGLAYINAHESLFGGVDHSRLVSEMAELRKAIADLTIEAEDCAMDAAKCKTVNFAEVSELPERAVWTKVNPRSSARMFVGPVQKNAKRVFEVRGFWSPFDHNPGPGVTEWCGPGENEIVTAHSNASGQDLPLSGRVPTLVPDNSLVYFQIADSYYGDNRTYDPDPVRVSLYEPVYWTAKVRSSQ